MAPSWLSYLISTNHCEVETRMNVSKHWKTRPNYKIKNFEKLKINRNKKKLIKIKYKENVGNMFLGWS